MPRLGTAIGSARRSRAPAVADGRPGTDVSSDQAPRAIEWNLRVKEGPSQVEAHRPGTISGRTRLQRRP